MKTPLPFAPPLRRSKLFWSGILAMVFIGWAWWLSYRGSAGIHRGDWSAANAVGGVSISKVTSSLWGCRFDEYGYGYSAGDLPNFPIGLLPAPQWIRGQDWLRNSSEDIGEGLDLMAVQDQIDRAPSHRAALELIFKYLRKDSWRLFIPHWLVMLLTAGIWTGLLVWWRRRMRRKMEVTP